MRLRCYAIANSLKTILRPPRPVSPCYNSICISPNTASSTASSSTTPNQFPSLTISIQYGLPTVVIPLPSRRENCQLMLKPTGDNVGSLCDQLAEEDSGISVVGVYTKGESATKIDAILILESCMQMVSAYREQLAYSSFCGWESSNSASTISTTMLYSGQGPPNRVPYISKRKQVPDISPLWMISRRLCQPSTVSLTSMSLNSRGKTFWFDDWRSSGWS